METKKDETPARKPEETGKASEPIQEEVKSEEVIPEEETVEEGPEESPEEESEETKEDDPEEEAPKVSTDFNAHEAATELRKLTDKEAILAFIEGDERKSVKAVAEKLLEKAPDEEVKSEEKAGPATVESIEQKYRELIDEIASFEVARRAAKKHVNFYTRHRRQVEVNLRNFSKFATR